MKLIFALLLICVLFGCQTPNARHASELEDTRRIGSEEIANLPSKLKYSDLVKIWGPGVAGDPFYFYQSKIDGITLAVSVNLEASDPFKENTEDGAVTEMYFIDMKDFRMHAWGSDILHQLKKPQKTE